MDFLFPTPDEIASVMRRISGVRIGVLGDYCVDAYWELDSGVEERSIETGLPVQRVQKQRYAPGGAGNVVVNLSALGVRQIRAFGVIGADLFGREITRMLAGLGADTSGLLAQSQGWDTPVYGKPLLAGIEQPRLDFGAFNHLEPMAWDALRLRLMEARDAVDFLIVNQQLPHGWCDNGHAGWVRAELHEHWAGRHLVDARQFVHAFTGSALKLNEREARQLLAPDSDPMPTAGRNEFGDSEAHEVARNLAALSAEPQVLTRGERGMLASDKGQLFEVPGVLIVGPTDTVGAGDTATAMLAATRAAGLDAMQAAALSNLAASVSVRKINQTGTVTESELMASAGNLAYVYRHTLSDEPRSAKYVGHSDIELVDYPVSDGVKHALMPESTMRYAVFDHDGTISTLRQGWESVMEPMMIRSILGERYASAASDLYLSIQRRVQTYIEQSTGIQTIAQMDALTDMVAEYGIVPPEHQLDAWGYKRTYTQTLSDMVSDRIRRMEQNELGPQDFIIKGAVDFARALRARDVTLYLVSGTDEADTVRESSLLGYADLFDGGIYGAKPGSRADTKDEVISSLFETIRADVQKNNLTDSERILVVGDGPVEIRLGRRYRATSLGVASTEERRFGLNLSKRRRLIRAGAHVVVPDFSQWQQIIRFLWPSDCDERRMPRIVPLSDRQP